MTELENELVDCIDAVLRALPRHSDAFTKCILMLGKYHCLGINPCDYCRKTALLWGYGESRICRQCGEGKRDAGGRAIWTFKGANE